MEPTERELRIWRYATALGLLYLYDTGHSEGIQKSRVEVKADLMAAFDELEAHGQKNPLLPVRQIPAVPESHKLKRDKWGNLG